LSFQSAAQRLGMNPVPYNHETSSSKKGESLTDTIKIVSGYADIAIIRHAQEGVPRLAADICDIPVINAGDGKNQHPTQTLIDLYTIQKAKGKIEGLNITLLGDLKHARTMRSLAYALSMFGANMGFISPKGLEMDEEVISECKKLFSANITQSHEMQIKGADVVYAGRVHKERFDDPYKAQKLQEEFRISPKILEDAKEGMILMHPLPKIDEIPPEVDSSPHAHYFQQAKNGVPVRMAILHDCLTK
ncbi:MAG: aspartate carbamoyltransferase, partial [Candidatus Micrarchaeota archaeon]